MWAELCEAQRGRVGGEKSRLRWERGEVTTSVRQQGKVTTSGRQQGKVTASGRQQGEAALRGQGADQDERTAGGGWNVPRAAAGMVTASAGTVLFAPLESRAFEQLTRTRSAIHLTLVTAAGLLRNSHSGIVQSEVTLDDLFSP